MSESAKQSLQPINYKYLTAYRSRLEEKTFQNKILTELFQPLLSIANSSKLSA